ncbi:MAG: MotA/TolQ/ExbB proton channel family protein [Gemmataceae bacterium]|nr:MotA/TolQ/ExbB proton channel family protein [Gemmataceae bacterium]
MGDQALHDLFDRGGPVMWPLLIASILAFATILDRVLVFAWNYQGFTSFVTAMKPLILARAWSKAEQLCQRRGPLAQFTLIYLEQRDQPKDIRDDVLKREGTLILGHLETRLRWLAALSQLGTLLGLLGTFYFMIYRFRPEATVGGQVQQAEFFTAIWESFLSTMFGLVIAIPCTTVYQLCEGRVDSVSRQLSVLASYLDEWRRTVDRPRFPEESRRDGKLTAIAPAEAE